MSRHHIYFPRSAYKTDVEKAFRRLPCHIIEMSEEGHRLLHREAFLDRDLIPEKPTHDQMATKIHYCLKICLKTCKGE